MSESINDKINGLLSDPDSLKSILSLVSGMTKESSSDIKEQEPEKETEEHLPVVRADDFDAKRGDSRFMRHDEDRINLLRSIRPFLDDRKRHKVDGIIRALGAARIINKYKDEDILGQLGFK